MQAVSVNQRWSGQQITPDPAPAAAEEGRVKIGVDYEVVTIANYRWNGEGREYGGIVNIPSGSFVS
jgi:hypothetical protein